MLNNLIGLYLIDTFDVKSDRIVFSETVGASASVSKTLANALNGAAVTAELNTYDYFLTKYTTWTSKGLMQIEIKPDNESINKIKTLSFTQKIESILQPIKYVQTDITVNLDNQIALENDVYIIIDLFKIPQTNTPKLYDFVDLLVNAIPNIDIQTLGIQKLLSNSNLLLKSILISDGGDPNNIGLTSFTGKEEQIKTARCKRI